MIHKTTIEMQKQLPTNDSDISEDVFIKRKLYSQKKIRHIHTKRRLSVSLSSFKTDLHIFDPEIREKYHNIVITAVMKLIFKKAAERVIKKLWRMPFPNGTGSIYIQQAQVTGVGMKSESPSNLRILLNEVHLGMKRSFLKWDKTGKKFPYRKIWNIRKSKGFFRSFKFNEVLDRANDPMKKNYSGHII